MKTDAADIVNELIREGFTIETLAVAAQKNRRQIDRWKNGESNPPDRAIAGMLRQLGKDPRDYGIITARIEDVEPDWAKRQHAEQMSLLRDIHRELLLIRHTG